MSLFDWLLVGHLVGDFLLQSDSMARYKVTKWSWMLKHVGYYTAVLALPLVVYAIRNSMSPWPILVALAFLAATHIIMDRRDITKGWMRLAGVTEEFAWLSIVVDQVFHVLSLAVVAQGLELIRG